MDARLSYVRVRMEEAIRHFTDSDSDAFRLPPEAFQHFTSEEEMPLPDRGSIEPFVRYRQAENVDLEALYRELRAES